VTGLDFEHLLQQYLVEWLFKSNRQEIPCPAGWYIQLPPGGAGPCVVCAGGRKGFDVPLTQWPPCSAADSLRDDELVFLLRLENRAEFLSQVDTLFDTARVNPHRQTSGLTIPQFRAAPGIDDGSSLRLRNLPLDVR